MATSGNKDVVATKTTSGNTGDTLRFKWSRKDYSTSGNYTNINWELQLIAGGAGKISSSANKKWSVTVNGNSYSGTNKIGIGNNETKTLANGTTKIPHNSDGTKTFSVSFSQQFDITFNSYVGTVSGSASFTLDSIPRYANFNGTPALSDITQTSVKISWSANATCSKVEYLLNGASKSTNSSLNASSGNYTYTGLTPNTSYTLAVKITRSDSGLVTTSSNVTSTTNPIATITSSVSFTVGEDLTLEFKNADKNESTIELSVENDSGKWVDIASYTSPINVSSFTLVLSESDKVSKLYSYCKNRNEMGVKVSCGVTLNGTYYGNTYTGKATISNSNPTFSNFLIVNTDTTCTNIIGNTSSTLQNMGNMQVQISTSNKAVAKNGASIVGYVAYLTQKGGTAIIKKNTAAYSDSSNVTINLGTHSSSGSYTINVYAIDSRDNVSTTIKKEFNIYPYHIPVPTIGLSRMNNFEKEIFLDLSIVYSQILISNSAKNSIKSIEYRYAPLNTSYSSWKSITGYTNNSSSSDDATVTYSKNTSEDYLMTIDIQKTYYFQFRITDSIQSVIVDGLSIEQGVPLLGEFEDGHITIGMLPDLEDSALLQVNSDIIGTDSDGNRIHIIEKINDVSNTVNNRKAGTRNYVKNTSDNWSDWWCPASSTTGRTHTFGYAYLPNDKKVGDQYTISFDIEWTKFSTSDRENFYLNMGAITNNFLTKSLLSLSNDALTGSGTKHISSVRSIETDEQASLTEFDITFYCRYSDGTGKIRIKNLQVEKGNLESDWHPAYEDTNIIALNNMKIACGYKTITATATTSAVVFSMSDLNELFDVSDCSNKNTTCMFSNGDGSLQNVHIEDATYANSKWYATFSGNAKEGSMQVNYTVIYFGNSTASSLSDGDEVSY